MTYFSKQSKPFNMVEKSTATAGLVLKSFKFTTKDFNEPKGIVSAAVNAIGVVDMQKDQLEPGAWTSVINQFHTRQQAWPSVLVNHEWSAGVGTVINAWEGDHLYVDAKFNMETQAGRDAFSNARAGVYKQWSVGFLPGDAQHDAHGVKHIKTVEAWPEVSLVLVGASPGTRTLATKSAGLSREAIAEIAAKVLRGLKAAPEAIPAPFHDQPADWEIGKPGFSQLWQPEIDPNTGRETGRYKRVEVPSQFGRVPKFKPDGGETEVDMYERWIRNWDATLPRPSDK